jgi:hypothetical protein
MDALPWIRGSPSSRINLQRVLATGSLPHAGRRLSPSRYCPADTNNGLATA